MPRVDAQLQRLLSDLLLREYDAGSDLVTVMDVHTTRDLKEATVIVSATADLERHVTALNRQARTLRNFLKPQLDFKIIPSLTFKPDAKRDEITRVESLLDQL